MLFAEVARKEGLFDWLAALAARPAKGSAKRLFVLVYSVGTVVTIFLSNDATAVVLTPAVYAAAKAAKAEPLPYLLICAFIANAASFVLPISNPANLVIFGNHMPPLAHGFRTSPRCSRSRRSSSHCVLPNARIFAGRSPRRSRFRRCRWAEIAAIGIGLAAVALLAASAVDRPLGLPTLLRGLRRDDRRPSAGNAQVAAARYCGTSHGASCRSSPGFSSWSRASSGPASWAALDPPPAARRPPRRRVHAAFDAGIRRSLCLQSA